MMLIEENLNHITADEGDKGVLAFLLNALYYLYESEPIINDYSTAYLISSHEQTQKISEEWDSMKTPEDNNMKKLFDVYFHKLRKIYQDLFEAKLNDPLNNMKIRSLFEFIDNYSQTYNHDTFTITYNNQVRMFISNQEHMMSINLTRGDLEEYVGRYYSDYDSLVKNYFEINKEVREIYPKILQKRKETRAVNKIKRWWIQMFWSPYTKVGLRRLMRSFENEEYSVW